MTKSQSPVDGWIDDVFGRAGPSSLQTPVFKPVPTPLEQKAEQTAHVARRIIEAEKEQRQANGARLRQARLEKEARDRASHVSNDPQKQQLDEAD